MNGERRAKSEEQSAALSLVRSLSLSLSLSLPLSLSVSLSPSLSVSLKLSTAPAGSVGEEREGKARTSGRGGREGKKGCIEEGDEAL